MGAGDRAWRGRVGYRVPVRRTVTYRIETRGRITTSVREFARQAAQTYADPRGWRNAGVAFKRVRGPSGFSLVLAEASWLPRFSSVCSVEWSCRAGRYVVINQVRWKYASPSWNGAGKSVRDYRHLVVNHETGHWLGHGHLGCPGPGSPRAGDDAAVKGLAGCRHNPWPLPASSGPASRTQSGSREDLEVLREVVLAVGDGRQTEHVEDQVADVAVADGLELGGVSTRACRGRRTSG